MENLNDIKPYKNISPTYHIGELMEIRNWDRSKLAEKLEIELALSQLNQGQQISFDDFLRKIRDSETNQT